MMKESSQLLDSGWQFKARDSDKVQSWLPVAKVPTNIHLDLLDNEIIEDPFLDFNELKAEWVNETSWIYRTQLSTNEVLEDDMTAVLSFDGLDTFATVYLDGVEILISDNMFHEHRVNVTSQVRDGQSHELEIHFDCAYKRAREIKDAHPDHVWVGFNGDMSRLAVRKAQYHWGWDWGPVLCPCGPWRPVRLEVFRTRISDVRVDYYLTSNLDIVTGTIKARIEGPTKDPIHFSISKDDRQIFRPTGVVVQNGTAEIEFTINNPSLWWPAGYGEQDMYDVTVSCGSELFSLTKKIGFRKVELVQQLDDVGKSFYFRINNVDVFCGGSNWIPADSFTPRITADRYRKWLKMMTDGHQSMIRIWGGGIYEEDIFFDLCDELGILVWHDFMFGCGNYPAFPQLLESIKIETEQSLRRIRHHPCISIFAGNNEDYQVQESFNLTYNFEDKDPESWLQTNFPARYIYEYLLPQIMHQEAPSIPYHPGSPWGDGLITSNQKVGDMHQWNVWHGTQEKYQIFDTLGGRFNSEFGMEAFPHLDTIKAFCSNPSELYAQSHTLDFHNKADHHERRIATYLVENFRAVASLEGHIHLSQMVQAEALMFGYRGWRQRWGKERFCGGALVWQLNDCWPVTSWSIVDYYQRKKPAYYAMRRVLAPIAIAVKREHWDWSVVHARPAKQLDWECWIASKELTRIDGRVEIRFVSIATGKDIKLAVEQNVSIAPNGTTDVYQGTIDASIEEPHVIAARLIIDEDVVARDCDWPQPLKYLDFKDRGLTVMTNEPGKMRITCTKPTKGLVFEEREGVLLDNSALDLVPGDEQVVLVTGLKEDEPGLSLRYLGMEES